MPPPPRPSEPRRVDPRIWRACAGTSVQVPSLNSRVYYFPQGHLEQCYSPTSSLSFLSSSLALSSAPVIPCRVSSVQFLSDPVTDEVFTKLVLDPSSQSPHVPESETLGDEEEEEKVVTFAKILTPSDANNGGGFSVPRFCADSIFPPLDYQAEPPVQTLTARDIHGVSWDFRHIYRGTPRRHLLTTGWSKFVNSKKLIAGDSVVFMRTRQGEMFIGVRRAVRINGGDCFRWRDQVCYGGEAKVKVKDEAAMRVGGGRERVSAEVVTEAVERAAQGLPFEVVYYPRAGWYSDFVVKAEVVDAALNGFWTPGMRVKMAVETDDSSRMTWFQGTVAAAGMPDHGPWRGSPWRMLQVTWDEPEVLQNVKRVSPWQVEFMSPTPPLHAAFPPAKKFRLPENSGLLTDVEGDMYFPMSGLTNSTMGHINSSLLNCHNFPAGMQGARQDTFSILGLSKLISENAPQMCADITFGNNFGPKLRSTSTEMNIGSPQSDNLSPDSQSSIHSFGNSSKVGIGSFQLFGKIIQMNQPVESGFGVVGCMEDGNNETDGTDSALDLSLTSSYTEFLDRIDVRCQRASAVEACSL